MTGGCGNRRNKQGVGKERGPRKAIMGQEAKKPKATEVTLFRGLLKNTTNLEVHVVGSPGRTGCRKWV